MKIETIKFKIIKENNLIKNSKQYQVYLIVSTN